MAEALKPISDKALLARINWIIMGTLRRTSMYRRGEQADGKRHRCAASRG
jgi:hypothetical protein